MKKNEEENIKRIGMRIKSARALTGLNQNDLCLKYGLSSGALKSWESGKFVPRMSNLQDLCNCLEKEGIFNATPSWFLSAEGAAPTHFQQDLLNSTVKNKIKSVDIQNEIDLFKINQQRINKVPIIVTVSDNMQKPFYSIGDIVGGIKMEAPPTMEQIQAGPLLIEYKENFLIRSCVSDGTNYFFKLKNDGLISTIDWSKLGQILWHRRIV